MHLLFDNVGVRKAEDLDLLEHWMLLKGMIFRDADSVMNSVMQVMQVNSNCRMDGIRYLFRLYFKRSLSYFHEQARSGTLRRIF